MTPLNHTPDRPRELTDEEVRRRLAWGRRQGHPLYVWPDVPRYAWRASAVAVAGTVAAGLQGRRPELSSPCGAAALGVAAYIAGAGPLLGRWQEDGLLDADEATADILRLHLAHGRRRAQRREELLRDAAKALSDHRPLTLLKGAHTGRSYFPEPGVRPAADVDLLVPEREVPAAEEALRGAGYRLTGRQARLRSTWLPPGEDGRIRALDFDHVDNPLRLDLHGSLARAFYGVATVDPGPPGPGDTVLVDPEKELLGLSAPLLMVVLATHASEDLHNLQLIRLVELVLVARALGAGCGGGWDGVLARARSAGALRFTYPALSLAEKLVPGTVDPRLLGAARAQAPPPMRRVVENLDPAHAQELEELSLQQRFMWVRGPGEAVRRMLHMLLPSSTGGSLRALVSLYGARILRLVRGRVFLRGKGGEKP